jgi:hypothetical protein
MAYIFTIANICTPVVLISILFVKSSYNQGNLRRITLLKFLGNIFNYPFSLKAYLSLGYKEVEAFED